MPRMPKATGSPIDSQYETTMLTQSNSLPGAPALLTDLGGGVGQIVYSPNAGAIANSFAVIFLATFGFW